jgi:DNA sulfur modification protein DndD
MDWRDKPFLANLSAGQRQIISIAFIASLARLAGKDDRFDLPLFMDTPFGRLDGEHRDKLIDCLPKLAKQWILLATDTEFTSAEVTALRETNAWGKAWILESVKPFHTQLKEVPVEKFVATRSSK